MKKPQYLLDTNIWIYLSAAARQPEKYAHLVEREAAAKNRVKLSHIVMGELMAGAAKSQSPQAIYKDLDSIRRRYSTVSFDHETTRHYALIIHATATQPIGSNDAWIAAQALRHGLTLVTHNTREFRRVPGLAVEDWVA